MFALAADLLTLCRVAAAAILVWLGASYGAASLSAAMAVTLGAWISDQLDGWAARRADRPTRLGRYDFAVDTIYYAGILIYAALAGFLPPIVVAGIAALVAGAWLATQRKAVVVICVRIIDLLCLTVLFIYRPWLVAPVLIWLGLSAWIYRRRLVERSRLWWAEMTSLVKPSERR